MNESFSHNPSPESFNPLQETETILKRFDVQTESFQEHHVWDALCEVRKKLAEGVEVPLPLMADMIAFEVNTVSINGENRQNSGLEECLTEDILAHWAMRARSMTNPLLRVTYADAHWHFAPLIGVRSPVDMAQIVIDASFEILTTKRYPNSIDARWYAQRALELSLKLRKTQAVALIIKTEDEISSDEKPGLWGFSFDYLLESSKVKLDQATITKLIQDLEGRLHRLTQPEILHLSASEAALTRLVSYYKRLNLTDESKRVISTYAKAILVFVDNADQSAFTRQHRLLELRELYLQNGMRNEAHALESKIHELGEISMGEMQTTTLPFEFSNEEMEEHVANFIGETLELSLSRIAVRYLIQGREDTEVQVKEYAQKFPFSYLFSQIIVDSSGRWVGQTSGLDADISPYLSQHVTRNLIISSVFLRRTISKILSHFNTNTDQIMEYFMKSPAFQTDKEGLIRLGLEAYLRDDFATVAHLWIPQIEEGIRQLAKQIGIEILKIDPHSHGYNYRDLGNLLDDPRLEQSFGVLGERLTFYFGIILNDKFGWNLRNDLCHGLMSTASFTSVVADRLFHIMLLLGLFRQPPEVAPD